MSYSWSLLGSILLGLGYVRHISLCLTSSAVILVPFPIVLLLEVLLAVSAVPASAGYTECWVCQCLVLSAVPLVLHFEKSHQFGIRSPDLFVPDLELWHLWLFH